LTALAALALTFQTKSIAVTDLGSWIHRSAADERPK
jgi:hypothetical protein